MSAPVILREVGDADLPVFFQHQRDPEAIRMAAFPARELEPFMLHWSKVRDNPSNITRSIVWNGEVAGNIGSWLADGRRLVGYWIGREFWGRGVASAALAAFIAEVDERPLHAFVAEHNAASIRVLGKCGFVPAPDHQPTTGDDGVRELRLMLVR